MFWTQEVLKGIDTSIPQLVNDSKTPSGEPHVGSLRGVLIHDAIYKVLRANGVSARYIFGSVILQLRRDLHILIWRSTLSVDFLRFSKS